MVKINRVYTGGGDGGESSLVDGSRRTKSDARFNVVGTCDEANSWLGMILAGFGSPRARARAKKVPAGSRNDSSWSLK